MVKRKCGQYHHDSFCYGKQQLIQDVPDAIYNFGDGELVARLYQIRRTTRNYITEISLKLVIGRAEAIEHALGSKSLNKTWCRANSIKFINITSQLDMICDSPKKIKHWFQKPNMWMPPQHQ